MTEERVDALESVVADTRALTVQDAEKAALVATLRPIAERLDVYVDEAARIKVATEADAARADTLREGIIADQKAAEAALREFNGGLIDRLHKAHRGWTGLLARFSDPLAASAKQIKGKIMAWQEAERRKAEAERARLQAIEDERARKEAARLAALAAQRKTPEVKARYEEAAAAVAPTVIHVAAPKGPVAGRRVWKVVNIDLDGFLEAAARDTNLRGYIEVKTTALERAKAANPMLAVPGVVYEQRMV